MSESEACPRCDGNGITEWLQPCPTCQGEGVIDPNRCERCHGSGKVPYIPHATMVHCPECNGTGKYPEETEDLPVFLPDDDEGNPREIREGL